jgi:hypothetical protein
VKKLYIYVTIISLTIIITSCDKTVDPPPTPVPVELEIDNTVALKWSELMLNHLKFQPSKTPTYVSRTLGYIGLTMYETVVNGSIVYQSVAPQLNGLGALPKPESGKKYDWETSLNVGQAYIIKKMWQISNMEYNTRLDSLEMAINIERSNAVKDTAIINRSIKYGLVIAETIYNWSKNDGGHLAYTRNFEPGYVFPKGNEYWIPPVNGQVSILMPMHPYWGKNRTFVMANAELPVPMMIPYSREKTSDFYKEFDEVYNIQKNLTQEQKEIANWWGDDPSETYAPPGHSYSIALQLARLKKPNLFVSASSFAKVGMSVADAFISCWKCKFTYHSLRPSTYIRLNINGNFNQYWPEPPFPAFVSGHSTQASAASIAMISVFGDNVAFEDKTHEGRPFDVFRNVGYKKRSYNSISETAIECGISRLYGGIHTRQDNEVGLAEGKKIGTNIAKLNWKKTF